MDDVEAYPSRTDAESGFAVESTKSDLGYSICEVIRSAKRKLGPENGLPLFELRVWHLGRIIVARVLKNGGKSCILDLWPVFFPMPA